MKNDFNNFKSHDLPKNIQKDAIDPMKLEVGTKSTVANEIHNLNKQFLFFLNTCIDQNYFVDLSPCVLDYLKFVDQIKSKFMFNGSSKETKNTTCSNATKIPITSASLTIDTNIPDPIKSVHDLKSPHFSPPLTPMLSTGSSTVTSTKSFFDPSSSVTTNANIPASTFSFKFNSGPTNSSIGNPINAFQNLSKSTAPSSISTSIWQLPSSTESFQQFSFAPSSGPFSLPSNSVAPSTIPQTSVAAFLHSLPSEKDSLGFPTQPITALSSAPISSGYPSFPFGPFQSTSNPLGSTITTPFSSMPLSSSMPFQPKTDVTLEENKTLLTNTFSLNNIAGFNTFSSPFSNNPISFSSVFSQQSVPFTADLSSLEKDKNIEYNAQSDEENQQMQNNDLGYESDAVFNCKSKLFVKGVRKYEEIGVGIFNLKSIPNDESSMQIVFRLESSRAGSLLMNIKIPKQSKQCSRNSPLDLAIISKPNPPISEVCSATLAPNAEIVTYLVKVKNKTDLDEIVNFLGLTPQ